MIIPSRTIFDISFSMVITAMIVLVICMVFFNDLGILLGVILTILSCILLIVSRFVREYYD